MKLEAVYFWAFHFKKFWNEKAPHNVWNWYTLCTYVKLAKSPYHIFDEWAGKDAYKETREEWYCIVDNLLEEMNRK